jgi:hypothetical protein
MSTLRQTEASIPVGNLNRQPVVSEAKLYAWKKKCAHLNVSELA